MPDGTTVKHAENDVIYDFAKVILINHSTVIKRNIIHLDVKDPCFNLFSKYESNHQK